MIAQVKLSLDGHKRRWDGIAKACGAISEASPRWQQEFKKKWLEAFGKNQAAETPSDWVSFGYGVHEVTEPLDEIMAFAEMWPGCSIEVARHFGAYKQKDAPNATPVERVHNQVFQVAIPNLGLLAIDEVCVVEDCCTNALQNSYLDNGWRILAVCPPACQRRPDYVLGRSKVARDAI